MLLPQQLAVWRRDAFWQREPKSQNNPSRRTGPRPSRTHFWLTTRRPVLRCEPLGPCCLRLRLLLRGRAAGTQKFFSKLCFQSCFWTFVILHTFCVPEDPGSLLTDRLAGKCTIKTSHLPMDQIMSLSDIQRPAVGSGWLVCWRWIPTGATVILSRIGPVGSSRHSGSLGDLHCLCTTCGTSAIFWIFWMIGTCDVKSAAVSSRQSSGFPGWSWTVSASLGAGIHRSG